MPNQDLMSYVEQRLDEWAEWSLRRFDAGLGYPKQSLLYQLLLYGQGLSHVKGPLALPVNAPAEEMEEMIHRLKKSCPFLAEVLIERYLGRGRNKAEKAELLGLGTSQYSAELYAAKACLAGMLMRN